ncbi:MAG TPA: hypothetical protein VGO19_07540, partial [Actinomycetes bacterium]
MSDGRQFLDRDTLAELWGTALGASQRLVRVDRLPGGSKKGVYRLTAEDSSTVVLYVWDRAENTGPEPRLMTQATRSLTRTGWRPLSDRLGAVTQAAQPRV